MIRQLKIRSTQKDVKMKEEVVKESALDRLLKARGKTRAEFEAEKNSVEEALNEDTAGEKFLDQEPETERGEAITEVLDACAKKAQQFYKVLGKMIEKGKKITGAEKTNSFNPLFIGPTGAGKTSIIKTWARDNGYEVVTINMMGDALDFLGVKDIDTNYDLQTDDKGNTIKTARVRTVATKAFDQFLFGNTKILFLDEINKTNPRILQALYDIISFHRVQNGDDVMFLSKLLFVVGAMNPSDYGSSRESLDPALKARMQIYHVSYDTEGLKKYLLDSVEEYIQEAKEELEELNGAEDQADEIADWSEIYERWCGVKDILETVFADVKKIRWTDAARIADTSEGEAVFIPRTFEAAVNNCDGTKISFIKEIKTNCGIAAAEQMNNILANYRDKEHKANLIWNKNYDVKEDEEDKSFLDSENDIEVSDEDKEATELKQSALRRLKDARRNN